MYDSISAGGADGYANGPYGIGQGYQGSNFGGAPGGVQNPINVNGAGGAQPPISITSAGGGMSPGEGLSTRRMMPGGRASATSAQGGLKPMLSQMLGLTPQQPQGGQRRGLGGQQRPGMGGPGRPIQGGPRPMPRPTPAPAPVGGGGTIRGGGGQGPVSGPRGRVQPGRRQGTI